MRLLYDNKLKGATLLAETPNSNYSVENLKSQFLRLKFKSLGISDIITITFEDDTPINSIFYGYSNASSMTAKLYSSASVLLKTVAIDCAHESGSAFFEQLTVRWITIEASCPVTEDLYIGGIACGVSQTTDDPLAAIVQTLDNLSGSSISGEGQVSNRYIEPLKKYQAQFVDVEKEKYYQTLALFRAIGTGHVWVDFTENNHAYHAPLYATTKMVDGVKKDRSVSFNIDFTEAR